MSSSFGNALKITIFGQSHAPAIGVCMEGFPAGFRPDLDGLSAFLARRAPGQGVHTTARREADRPEFLSGFSGDHTPTPAAAITPASRTCRVPPMPTTPRRSSGRARRTPQAAGIFPAASPRRCVLPAGFACNI